MPTDASAPGELDLVRRFVNTRDVEAGTDTLATWPEAGGPLGPAELGRAAEFREALREVLAGHHGAPVAPGALGVLAAAAGRAPVAVRFAPGGGASLEPVLDGLDGTLGRLLAIAARADAEGTWRRLKVCPASECRWAFYDRSRNRSRTWCTMEICGNRSKARAYRARTRRDP